MALPRRDVLHEDVDGEIVVFHDSFVPLQKRIE